MAQTRFDAMQNDYQRHRIQATEAAMIRDVLACLDPQDADMQLDDLGVLQRLHAVLGQRIQQEEARHGRDTESTDC